jgi:hypothetical protein
MQNRRAVRPWGAASFRPSALGQRILAVALTACLLTLGGGVGPIEANSDKSVLKAAPRPVSEVRTTYTGDFGLRRPGGLAFDPVAGTLLVAGRSGHQTRVLRLSPSQDLKGATVLPRGNTRTLSYDARSGRVALLDGADLVTAPLRGPSRARPRAERTRDLGIGRAAGATYDSSGALLTLDASRRSVVRRDRASRVSRISLAAMDGGARAIAFNPANELLYALSADGELLYALDSSGEIRRTHSLRSLKLESPVAMTFAPSADASDDPERLNLFIADSGSGGITEVKLAQVAVADVPVVTANLVRTIDTSTFQPASPDPAGITYMPEIDRLMMADSEVDEQTGAGYHGVNMWELTRAGGVSGTGTTLAYTREPTGLGYDHATRTLFISSDDNGRIYVIKRGADNRFGTSDDLVSSIDVAALGVTDAEDPEFDPASGHLFFLDGISTEVYRIDPVNGVFGDNDDLVSHFDVGQYGATDVEGLGSDQSQGTLLVGDRGQRRIYEVTKQGVAVRIIDARVPGMINLSGLTMAPASNNSGAMNYWTVDRVIDNGPDPNENDGKIFELSVASSGNQAPVVNSVIIDQSAPKTNDTLTATVTASDPDGDALDYSYQWNKGGIAIPGATQATLDLALAGNGDKGDAISLRVIASDGQAQGVRTSTQVIVDNSFPAFDQDLGDRSNAESESVSIPAGASDADGDTLGYQAAGLPSGVSIDAASGLISGTLAPGAAASSPYDVSVTVRDNPVTDDPEPQPIALVQKKSGDQSATEGNSLSLAYDSTPTQGNLLVAVGHASANRTPTIPAGWNLALETGGSADTVVFYKVAGAGEPATVTFSVSGSAVFMGLAIFEYRGLHDVQSEVLDRTVFGTTSSATSISTGTTQPTTQDDELLVASVATNATRSFNNAWSNGFGRQTVERRQTIADRIVAATDQFQTSESWNTAAGASGSLVSFKSGGAATPPPPEPNPGSATDSFTWTITEDPVPNEPPTVTSATIDQTDPRTDDSLSVTIEADDPDGDPLTYAHQWLKNGNAISAATGPTLNLSVPGNGDKGDAISVRVTASDDRATSAPVTSAEVTVTEEDLPPSVEITSPGNGSVVRETVSAEATASDGDGVEQVEFFVGTTSLGVDSNGADGWSVTWDTTSGDEGPRTLRARATDTAGQTADHSIVTTVDNVAPTVAITSPPSGSTVSFTVPVSADAVDASGVASVDFMMNGTSIGLDADGSNGWSVQWDTTTVPNGTHEVTASARDLAGNETLLMPIHVTVDNPGTFTMDRAIASSPDDVEERSNGRMWPDNGDLELVTDGSDVQAVGLRFTDLGIPRGVNITHAYVQFQVDHTSSVATNLTVRAQSADHAAPFTTVKFNLSSRPRTAASVAWSPPPWTKRLVAEEDQRTPDLSAVLQEVVDRPGWASGNALALVISGSGSRVAESFDGGFASILHVEYTA